MNKYIIKNRQDLETPLYPDEEGNVEGVSDGWFIAKKFPEYVGTKEDLINIYDGYLPSHYECIVATCEVEED